MIKGDTIRLRKVKPTNLTELVEVMQPEEVWRAFDFVEPPKLEPGYRMALAFGKWAGVFIHGGDDDRILGCVVLECQRLKKEGIVEVDIAITDASVRGQGLSLFALARLFDDWLLGGRTPKFWAWVDKNNAQSMGMITAMKIPQVGPGERVMTDGRVLEGTYIEMSKEHWTDIRPTLAKKLGLGDEPYVMPG